VSEHNFFIASLGGSAPYAETPPDVAADYWDCSNDENIRVTYIENPAPETSNSKKKSKKIHGICWQGSPRRYAGAIGHLRIQWPRPWKPENVMSALTEQHKLDNQSALRAHCLICGDPNALTIADVWLYDPHLTSEPKHLGGWKLKCQFCTSADYASIAKQQHDIRRQRGIPQLAGDLSISDARR